MVIWKLLVSFCREIIIFPNNIVTGNVVTREITEELSTRKS